MKFLHGKALSAAIASALSADRQDIAVAFIGRGAAKRLGIIKGSRARVICDLWSGACNPEAIRELIQAGATVKRRDRLHAKVYFGDRGAVICSANASISGFAEAALTQDFGLEAGVVVNDAKTLASIKTWFDAQFASASEVTTKDIDRAAELWLRRPRRPATSTSSETDLSVLARAITVPDAFPGLGFVFSNTSVSKKEREKALKDARRRLPEQAAELTTRLAGFHGWDEDDVLDWPTTFLAFHRAGEGKLYLNGNRFIARNEARGDVFAKADWTRISAKHLHGASKTAVVSGNQEIASEILRTVDGGLVFPTAKDLSEYYERLVGDSDRPPASDPD